MIPTLILFFITTLTIFINLSPLLLLTTLFLYNGIEISHLNELLFSIKILLFFTSLLFCTYTILDTTLGISLLKKTKSMQKYQNSMRYSKPCQTPFQEIQKIFHLHETQLLITTETEPKCYPLSSISQSHICISINMLDTLTMRSTPSEFPTFLKIILARQALTLSQNNHLEQSLTQMHQSISTLTKVLNSKIFQIISHIFKIIPLIGPHLSSTTLLFHKLIEKLLTFTNSSLIITYHIINKLLFSKNNQYYDTKLAQLFGGEIVSKTMSITETPNYKILSTSNNIHKRIEKVSKIKKIPNLTIPTLIPQITTLITIILMFSSLIYLSYEIRIWRLYQFAHNFPTQLYHHIEDQITNL